MPGVAMLSEGYEFLLPLLIPYDPSVHTSYVEELCWDTHVQVIDGWTLLLW
jgi:hypothetical protein